MTIIGELMYSIKYDVLLERNSWSDLNLRNGVYIIQIRDLNGNLYNGKVVITK